MKHKFLAVFAAVSVAVSAMLAPANDIPALETSAYAAKTTVSAPKANRSSGTFTVTGSIKIKLSCKTEGAGIYYSLNGAKYKRYTKSITISKNSTLKVYAKADGVKSKTVTYTYKLSPKINFSLKEGEYDEPQNVKLSSPVSGVKYYYTLDGSKPTKNSKLYDAKGIDIEKTSTLRLMSVKSGWETRYVTKNYTVNVPEMSGDDGSMLSSYKNKYCYSKLNNAQKKAYALLFKAAAEHGGTINLEKQGISINQTELEKAYWAFDYDNPQFYWLGNGYSYGVYSDGTTATIEIDYSRTKNEAAAIKDEFDAAAEKIISKALQKEDEFERVRVLHDELINMTKYTLSGGAYISEADGPLVYGKALCEGYSKAFMYLCQSIGVPCICVIGTSGEGHMWNMAYIDGDWYHVDVTWDDPLSNTGEDVLRDDYFCVSTDTITEDHVIKNIVAIPKADKDYEV